MTSTSAELVGGVTEAPFDPETYTPAHKAPVAFKKCGFNYIDGPRHSGKLMRWLTGWFEQRKRIDIWGVDTETLGLNPMKHRVRLLQIGNADYTMIIDLDAYRTEEYGSRETKKVPWHRPELKYLKDFLEDETIPKVFQNAQFDINMLNQAGITVRGPIFDTYVAAKIINNGKDVHNGLGDIVRRELGYEMDKSLQKSDWGAEVLDWEQLKYAALDVNALPRLVIPLRTKLRGNRVGPTVTLHNTFELEMAAVYPIASMQINGFGFDVVAASKLHGDLVQEAAELQRTFLEHLDAEIKKRHPVNPEKWLPRDPDGSFNTRKKNSGRGAAKLLAGFNPGSNPQMIRAMTDAGIILPPKPGTTDGGLSLDKTLLAFMRADYTLIDEYMTWNDANTAVSCLESLQKAVHSDGRIHCCYNQMGTATGRMSAKEPNLQQVPRSKRFRSLFVPKEGYCLIGGDFSQIELRVVAELSEEPKMIEAYIAGRDLHMETAALIAKVPHEEVTDSQRQSAKVANFGLLYGAGAATLRKQAIANYRVAMTMQEAVRIRRGFQEAYPQLLQWQQDEGSSTRPACFTRYGRRRLMVGFKDKFTSRLNTPVQGTAGDIAKIALVMLWEEILTAPEGEVFLIGAVHDEIIGEVRIERAEYWKGVWKRCMEEAGGVVLKKVPVVADVKVGKSWAETK